MAAPVTDAMLTADRRSRDLAALRAGQVVDVLVVGGGVTGAGVALDAASRGLSVALIERRDLAAGTSRWSTKLAHGGLRYIAAGQIGVAWESLVERNRLVTTIAPHLVQPMAFMVALEWVRGCCSRLPTACGWRRAPRRGCLASTGSIRPRPSPGFRR
jgi:glycerol-3-phosphate dehydrogenase